MAGGGRRPAIKKSGGGSVRQAGMERLRQAERQMGRESGRSGTTQAESREYATLNTQSSVSTALGLGQHYRPIYHVGGSEQGTRPVHVLP